MPDPESTKWTIRTASSQDAQLWNDFVLGHPEASLYHLFQWRSVLRRAYRKRCYYLIATVEEGCRAVLPLAHMKGPLAANRLVSLPFLDQGGVLAESTVSEDALSEAGLQLTRELGAKGLDLRGPSNGGGRQETRRFRLLLRLPESEALLWKTVGPKVRNQIRKSERSGLETRRAPADRLGEFYSVFSRNMRDLGAPVHSRRFFREVLSGFGADASLFLTRDAKGSPVAGAVSIRFRNTVAVPWASSLRSARSSCPNHSLYWRILLDSRDSDARAFDFGRSFEGSGTFHFMKQWGATPQPLLWRSYDSSGHPRRERLLASGRHGRLVHLWRSLPTAVANTLGPLVRRQLSN